MNVVAKSTNLSPLLKSATSVVSSGLRPVAGTGNAVKQKIIVMSSVNHKVNQSISESILSGPLRVSSGITGSKSSLKHRFMSFRICFNKLPYYIFRLYNRAVYTVCGLQTTVLPIEFAASQICCKIC